MIREALVKLSQKHSLSEQEAYETMLEIFEEKVPPVQIASYLTFLNIKGETADEVIGSVRAMREKMVRVNAEGLNAIDVCGTGGDHRGSFNISTSAALVLAGGGVTVAKHGNRAATSQCGSAEVLDNLGVKIDPPTHVIENCLQECKMAFLFAPHFHPAMKYVGPIRKELPIRTIFNFLGPMCNPASVKRQVIGVSDPTKVVLIGEALIRSGSQKVVLVNSQDGLDEISPAAPTAVSEWDGSRVRSYTISPADFGFKTHSLNDILGGNSAENAQIVLAILNGTEQGPKREAVVMNAAAGFYAAGMASSIVEGKSFAEASIDSGEAMAALEALKKASNL